MRREGGGGRERGRKLEERGVSLAGIKYFNSLPANIKGICVKNSVKKFLNKFLIEKEIYRIEGFISMY